MMQSLVLLILISLFIIPSTFAASCESPKYSSSEYSTQDGFFHYETTYIVEFALQCANNYQQSGQFYAIVNGKSYQLAVSEETSKYQVSWQLDHPESGSQTFDVNIYDEDKYAEYRKAVASGSADPTSSVGPLFTYQYYHPGVSKKGPVSSESVCLLLGAAAVYYALYFKQQLAKRD